MSQQRIDYFRDLATDFQATKLHKDLFLSFVLADSINGLRKALLEINDSLRESRHIQSRINQGLSDLHDALERRY